MKITPKQLRQFYVGCAKLYGAVDSNDAFEILKHYYPDADKKSFVKDLSSRVDKYTRDYAIWMTGKKNLYLIVDEFLGDEDLDNLLSQQQGKEFYIPETIEKLLRHSTYEYWKQVNDKEVKALSKILDKGNKVETSVTIGVIFEDFKAMSAVDDVDPLTFTLKRILYWGYELTQKQMEELLSIIQKLFNNTRLPSNRGYTPNELRKKSGPVDINNVEMTLGPNIIRMLEDGEMDINEYLNDIINSNMPPKMKESLIKQVCQIKDRLDSAKA